MAHLGLTVMMKMLGMDHGKAATALESAIGKTIARLTLEDNELRFRFTDGTGLRLWDDGQTCCESRYFTTDDDLAYYRGAILNGADVHAGPSLEGEDGDVHETAFLKVSTSKGVLTCETHNEHNGYYGGFWVEAAAWEEGR